MRPGASLDKTNINPDTETSFLRCIAPEFQTVHPRITSQIAAVMGVRGTDVRAQRGLSGVSGKTGMGRKV